MYLCIYTYIDSLLNLVFQLTDPMMILLNKMPQNTKFCLFLISSSVVHAQIFLNYERMRAEHTIVFHIPGQVRAC